MEETQRVPIEIEFGNESETHIAGIESAPTPSRLSLYERALLLQKKKEMMRQLVPKECTFTPNLSKTLPSRPSTSLPSPSFRLDTELSVHERLYKIAEIHRERLEMRRANSTQHLFSPAITPKAADLKAAEEAARLAGKPVDPPGERLYNLSQEIRERIEKKREKFATEGCTFQPKITPKAKTLVREGSTADRLYNPEWVRNRHRPENNDPEFSRSTSLTFRPKVNVTSHAILESTLSQPSPLAEARSIQDVSASAVPDKLRYLALHTSPLGSADSFTRLYNHALAKHETKVVREEIEKSAPPPGCTFTPNATSPQRKPPRRPGSAVKNADGAENTYDRLYLLGEERRKRREQLAKQGEDARNALDSECTFEPAISETSKKIAELLTTVEYDENGNPVPVPSRHEALYLDGVAKAREKAERELLEYFDIHPATFDPAENDQDTIENEEADALASETESFDKSITDATNKQHLTSSSRSSPHALRTLSARSASIRMGSASRAGSGLYETPTSPMAAKAWADSLRS